MSAAPQDRHRSRIRRLGRAATGGVVFGIVLFVAGLGAAWGADVLFPPTVEELALVKRLRLSDGYGSLAAMAGIVFLSVLAAGVGCVIGLIRPNRPRAA